MSAISQALTPHPASLPLAASPEPPGALDDGSAAPWLAPSTSMAAGAGRRLVTRLRLPSAAEHCALLLAGWSTTGTRGVYERGGRRVWWSRVAAGGASE